MMYRNPSAVINQLWRQSKQNSEPPTIYAILDAARNKKIYPMLMTSYAEYTCLYKGDIPKALAEVAPYLILLNKTSKFTEWLIQEGWGDSWGILCAAPVTMEHLRRHFRQFLMAQIEGGEQCYFRYYDPRVLRVYLPTCNSAEREDLFGPVERFLVEGEDRTSLIEYALTSTNIRKNIFALEGVKTERGGNSSANHDR